MVATLDANARGNLVESSAWRGLVLDQVRIRPIWLSTHDNALDEVFIARDRLWAPRRLPTVTHGDA